MNIHSKVMMFTREKGCDATETIYAEDRPMRKKMRKDVYVRKGKHAMSQESNNTTGVASWN